MDSKPSLEEKEMPIIEDDSTVKMQKYISSCPMRLYQIGLYIGFIEGIATTIYFIVRFCIYGFDDPDELAGDAYGGTVILNNYLTITEAFVFWAGITAYRKQSLDLQERFYVFIKVLFRLLIVLLIFLGIGFFNFIDQNQGFNTEESYLIQGGVHILFFGGMTIGSDKLFRRLKRYESDGEVDPDL
jgi:hypothetical protein